MATKKKVAKKVIQKIKEQVEAPAGAEAINSQKVLEENKLLKEQLAQQQLQTSMSSTEIYRYQHLAAINNQTEVIRNGVNAIGSILSDLLDKDQEEEDTEEDVDEDDEEAEE